MFQRILYYSGNPIEIGFLIQMKFLFKEFKPSDKPLSLIGKNASDDEFCSEALKKVSRSFSVVIHQLPKELQDPVQLFYLILRGLDTVEDDMSLPEKRKDELLTQFSSLINQQEFSLTNVGDTQDYRDLMANFEKVVRKYQLLDEKYKVVITDITERMATGMKKYAHTKVKSLHDWDDYCYYVAGLVGIGLSKLFLSSGIETNSRLENEALSNEMGLFLQKTNIIRDYAEDLDQERIFWPSDVWSKYVFSINQLQQNKEKGMVVVNELICNALSHIPSCLEYLESLSNEKVFRFCAIPQLMAIETLKKLYCNELVLTESVKIRKGKTARFFMSKQNFKNVVSEFKKVLLEMNKIQKNEQIVTIINHIETTYGRK